MNRPKKKGVVMVITGAVLVLSALLLYTYNQLEDSHAGQEAENLVQQLQAAVTEPYEISPQEELLPTDSTEPTETQTDDPGMKVVVVDGYGYIGYLAIPALEVDLPVMEEWDYNRLKIAPCRHAGSYKSDDLVIAAHNYKSHFGYLNQLQPNDAVTFTDMDGNVHAYSVSRVDEVMPDSVEEVLNSGHDLVLYTCTTNRQKRVAVFCDREGSSEEAGM